MTMVDIITLVFLAAIALALFFPTPSACLKAEALEGLKERYDFATPIKSEMIEAVNYLEVVIDRQVAKASGILAFDALMLTVVTIFYAAQENDLVASADGMRLVWLIMVAFLGSGSICLVLFRVNIPAKSVLESFERELESSANHIFARSGHLERAVRLSLLGTCGIAAWVTWLLLIRPLVA